MLTIAPRQVLRAVPMSGLWRVNPHHPLARGMIGYWLPGMHERANLAPVPVTDLNSLAFVAPVMTAEGPSNPTVYAPASQPPLWGGTEKSLYWRGVKLGASTGAFAGYIQVSYINGSISPFTIWGMDMGATDASSGRLTWNAGAGQVTLAALPTCPVGAVRSFGATFKVGGNATAYSAGLNVGSASFGAGAPSTTSLSQLWLHANVGGSGSGFLNAGCLIACAWDRELTAAEMQQMDADPYGILIPVGVTPTGISLGGGGASASRHKITFC